MSIFSDIFAGFITTMKGMAVTGKELFVPTYTVQYPKEKRVMPERFRGMLVCDASRCIACNKCVRICPADCLVCEGTGKGKERRAALYSVDYVKCCWCGLCVDACPTNCLAMSRDYETVFTDRSQMVREFCSDPVPPFNEESPDGDPKGPGPDTGKKEKADSGRAAA